MTQGGHSHALGTGARRAFDGTQTAATPPAAKDERASDETHDDTGAVLHRCIDSESRTVNRLADVVDTTRLLAYLCDADVIDVTARIEHLHLGRRVIGVVQAHVLVSGLDGAVRLARTTRLTPEPADDAGVVVWRTWVGWVDLGRDDVLLSIRVTTAQTTSVETTSTSGSHWEQRPDDR